jgi:glycerophosphoryl diester phosphodiesterase
VLLGERPLELVSGLDAGPLKDRLDACRDGPFRRSGFSIAHRGAPLRFPEHTRQSYEAAALQGAGIVECDVTFTADGELVCRHAECDLHATTDIVTSPLHARCEVPWTGAGSAPKCCASALSLAEFRTLGGTMEGEALTALARDADGGGGARASDPQPRHGTLMTFAESIRLNQRLGVRHAPELKSGDAARIAAVFGSQQRYAQAFIDTLRDAGVRPEDAWPQSFDASDVLYWVRHTAYGEQAVFLVDYDAAADDLLLFDTSGRRLAERDAQLAFFGELRRAGVRIVAPPMPALLAVDGSRIVPSPLARDLRRLGFELITWTLERSDLRAGAAQAGFYYDFDPTGAAVTKEADLYKVIDVLARDVRVLGIFSDWPATVTYYANCMGLE